LLITELLTTRTLSLNATYTGGSGLNENMQIDILVLYYAGLTTTYQFPDPLQITGTTKIVIPIQADQKNNKQNLRIETM
jgi:hypothetical protein